MRYVPFTNCWLLLPIFLRAATNVHGDLITDETVAKNWLEDFNKEATKVYYDWVLAYWNYNTNLTSHNQRITAERSLVRSEFLKEAYKNASMFDWQNFQNDSIKRLFRKITDVGYAKLPAAEITKVDNLHGEMQKIYSTGKVCNKPGDIEKEHCYPLDPDLTHLFATSRDWDVLLWGWKGWRESTRDMVDTYEQFVGLHNKAAKLNDYVDNGEYWRSSYEMEKFEEDCLRLWEQVKPLYSQLHAYVRRKLKTNYENKPFPSTGHLPAHVLGNMWGQTWSNVMDLVIPYKDAEAIDVTSALQKQGYNATTMFKLAEEFFVSIGLDPLPASFWKDSMLVKPSDGREVVCHASAWDFYNGKDFRIKQCTEMTQEWLFTTHHELGHIAYQWLYKDLHVEFRRGANPGFHEAVGDVLALSVATPEHLHEVGLLEKVENNTEADLNYLMSMALDKIAFLPFGYLIDQWRWSVFSGETPRSEYNKKWWELRCKHQGLAPPLTRTQNDFDPGAKFHIPNNTPYIRYFVSFIIQFQFHKALCDAAGKTGPLHRCDIYRSKDAGEKLANMLRLGSSQPWPVAMKEIAGTEHMDAQPLLDYFAPLHEWLKKENEGHEVGWDEECPPEAFEFTSSATLPSPLATPVMSTLLIVCLIVNSIRHST